VLHHFALSGYHIYNTTHYYCDTTHAEALTQIGYPYSLTSLINLVANPTSPHILYDYGSICFGLGTIVFNYIVADAFLAGANGCSGLEMVFCSQIKTVDSLIQHIDSPSEHIVY